MDNDMRTTIRTRNVKHARGALIAQILLLLHFPLHGQNDPIAPRGQVPIGSYTFSDLETVDNVSGNLSYRIPLTSFAPDKGGFTWGLSLVYNSNIYDAVPGMGYEPGYPDTPVVIDSLQPSEFGGWRYAINYGPQLEACNQNGQGNDYGSCVDTQSPAQNVDRLNLIFPDGSHHTLHLQGQPEDQFSLGYTPYDPSGAPASPCQKGSNGNYIYDYLSGNLTYYTTDSTYIKVVIPTATAGYSCAAVAQNPQNYPYPIWTNSQWTMYFPDGKIATGYGLQMNTLADKNGNTMLLANTYLPMNGVPPVTAMIPPAGDGEIEVFYGSEDSGDTYSDEVFNYYGPWKINWQYLSLANSPQQYTCTATGDVCNLNGTNWMGVYPSPVVLQVVTSIEAPADCYAGSCPASPTDTLGVTVPGVAPGPGGNSEIVYNFGYSGGATGGAGTLQTVTLPSTASATYTFQQDNHVPPLDSILFNPVVNKQVTWYDQSDGGNAQRQETTIYTFSSGSAGGYTIVQAPDQGSTTYSYQPPSLNNSPGLSNEVYKVKMPDGSLIERVWAQNLPPGIDAPPGKGYDPGNPYVAEEVRTAASAGAALVSSVKEYTYDANGNQTNLSEYGWTSYGNIPHLNSNTNNPVTMFSPTGLIRSTAVSPVVSAATGSNQYWNPSNSNLYGLLQLPASKTVTSSSGNNPASYDQFLYDGLGNLQHELHWDSTKTYSPSLNRTNASVIDRNYDQYGNLTDIYDPNNTQTHLVYGSVAPSINPNIVNLWPTSKTEAYGTGLARTTTYSYNSTNNWLHGIPNQVVDYNGMTRTVSVDFLGRKVGDAEGSGSNLLTVWSASIDDVNRKMQVISTIGTNWAQQSVSATFYDQLGRTTLTEMLECTSLGPQGQAGQCSPLQTTDQNVAVTSQTGIKVQTRYLYQAPYTYKLVSNPYRAGTSSAAGGEDTMGWTLTRFDQNGRVNKVMRYPGATPPPPFNGTDSDGGCPGSQAAAYSCYSASSTLGSSVAQYDEVGNNTLSYTDGLGRLAQVTEYGFANTAYATSLTTTYSYDTLDDLTSVAPGYGSGRSFTYDSLRRLQTAYNPESGTTSYTYDENGNLTSRTDARNIVTCYGNLNGSTCDYSGYDQLNRPTKRSYSDGTATVTYLYNGAMDQLFSVTSGDTTNTYSNYDVLNRPGTITQSQLDGSFTSPVSETYTGQNEPATITYPSGRVVTTSYDDAGRPIGVSSATNTYATVASGLGNGYAAHGDIRNVTLGHGTNAVTQTRSYDGKLEPLTITAKQNSTQQLQLTMQYLANGNVSSEQIARPGFTAYQGFAYDGANRLCSATESASPGNGPANCTATPPGGLNWAQQYVYDPVGNQAVVGTVMPGLTATPMAVSVTSTVPFNSQNQYTGAGYDNAGNMKSVSAATMQFTYDAEGRMITETDNGASPPLTATFTYDGQGRRVRKATAAGTTYYTYGPMGELISETGGTALPKTTYLTADHLGSTRLVTNSAGYLGCHDYLPFGQEILASYGTRANSLCYDLPDTDIQFTGQVRDTDTTFELDNFGARYLSGAMGRFTSADSPFADQQSDDPQSWNLYAYARNNPLKYVDPTGDAIELTGDEDQRKKLLEALRPPRRIAHCLRGKCLMNVLASGHCQIMPCMSSVTWRGRWMPSPERVCPTTPPETRER
jgi:RHS repeat-associated protein